MIDHISVAAKALKNGYSQEAIVHALFAIHQQLVKNETPATPTPLAEDNEDREFALRASLVDDVARVLSEANGTSWDFVEGGSGLNDPYYRDAFAVLDFLTPHLKPLD